MKKEVRTHNNFLPTYEAAQNAQRSPAAVALPAGWEVLVLGVGTGTPVLLDFLLGVGTGREAAPAGVWLGPASPAAWSGTSGCLTGGGGGGGGSGGGGAAFFADFTVVLVPSMPAVPLAALLLYWGALLITNPLRDDTS